MPPSVRHRGAALTNKEREEYCRPIVGSELVSVERRDYSWFFEYGADIFVATEAPWRLIADGRIVVTSEDHGHQFGLPERVDAAAMLLARVRGRRAAAAAIAPSTGDLTIDFVERMQLQFLQMSLGYESWRLFVQATEIVCCGGGEIVHVPTR
jgi:hypothetical protein